MVNLQRWKSDEAANVSTSKPYDWEREQRALEYLERKGKEREEWIRSLKAGLAVLLILVLALSFLVGMLFVWR